MCPRIMPMLAVLTLLRMLLAEAPTQAQEHHANHGYQGQHGVGHERWHEQFYSKLMRKDTKTSCCNLSDCVPTQSRMINDHYEVLVEGEWTKVPQDVIQNVTAPDGARARVLPQTAEQSLSYGHVVLRRVAAGDVVSRRRLSGCRSWCDVADAGDDTDGNSGPHPDDPGSSAALAAEGNVDTERPQSLGPPAGALRAHRDFWASRGRGSKYRPAVDQPAPQLIPVMITAEQDASRRRHRLSRNRCRATG